MPAPTITALPAAPLRSQTPANFTSAAEAFVDALEDLPAEINAFGEYLNSYSPGGAYTPGGTDVALADGGTGASTPAGARTNLMLNVLTWDFNFADDGDAYVRAPTAMTITEQATSGTGTIAYEKSTAAAPNTFASTTSPITLEAGAKLKVSASAITGSVAVHLERTA